MSEAIEHKYHDAILMSLSALALMATHRHACWQSYARLAANKDVGDQSFHEECRDRESKYLRRLCELVDEAMQYIGDVNSNTDCVDDYGMTDSAFEAMDRALRNGD